MAQSNALHEVDFDPESYFKQYKLLSGRSISYLFSNGEGPCYFTDRGLASLLCIEMSALELLFNGIVSNSPHNINLHRKCVSGMSLESMDVMHIAQLSTGQSLIIPKQCAGEVNMFGGEPVIALNHVKLVNLILDELQKIGASADHVNHIERNMIGADIPYRRTDGLLCIYKTPSVPASAINHGMGVLQTMLVQPSDYTQMYSPPASSPPSSEASPSYFEATSPDRMLSPPSISGLYSTIDSPMSNESFSPPESPSPPFTSSSPPFTSPPPSSSPPPARSDIPQVVHQVLAAALRPECLPPPLAPLPPNASTVQILQAYCSMYRHLKHPFVLDPEGRLPNIDPASVHATHPTAGNAQAVYPEPVEEARGALPEQSTTDPNAHATHHEPLEARRARTAKSKTTPNARATHPKPLKEARRARPSKPTTACDEQVNPTEPLEEALRARPTRSMRQKQTAKSTRPVEPELKTRSLDSIWEEHAAGSSEYEKDIATPQVEYEIRDAGYEERTCESGDSSFGSSDFSDSDSSSDSCEMDTDDSPTRTSFSSYEPPIKSRRIESIPQ